MAFGANGILGVSVFNEDCGPGCVSSSSTGFYYSCTSTACAPTTVALAKQLPNPVRLFVTNNNGVIITLASVPSQGAATLTGTMLFGIDTQSNNKSGTQKILTLNSQGDFTTDFNNQSLPSSFFDTGSSGLYFNDSNLTPCSATGGFKGFYCPTTTQNLSATLQGTNAVSSTAAFSVANAESASKANPTYAVFVNLAGTYPASGGTGVFDWGLPFYFGKTVYTAFEGQTTSGGTGPYVAF